LLGLERVTKVGEEEFDVRLPVAYCFYEIDGVVESDLAHFRVIEASWIFQLVFLDMAKELIDFGSLRDACSIWLWHTACIGFDRSVEY